ncbi:hypothetical protein IWQ60_010564 [Tieghemiomyces parasiticus]|uniref:DUF7707 domain-containing protein n=1 Tax=Tieghemiomyces parasiticus TaxID=78921 RepID=A0A9W7ZR64_9FUNG|nr:hypothetical protein IWQ60_010564 [Tieghemiomyces parasiticus]
MRFTFTTGVLTLTALAATALASSGGWNITHLPVGERKTLCATQAQVCVLACGSPELTTKAFCNYTTMGWGCACKDKTPEYDTYNLPVVGRDCEGFAKDCVDKCKIEPDCIFKCRDTWQCHTQNAPDSYLEVDSVDEMPAYKFVNKSRTDKVKSHSEAEKDDSSAAAPGLAGPHIASLGAVFLSVPVAALVAGLLAL